VNDHSTINGTLLIIVICVVAIAYKIVTQDRGMTDRHRVEAFFEEFDDHAAELNVPAMLMAYSASASFRMRDTSSGTASTETLSRSALADRMNHHFGRIDRYYVDREILSVSSSPAEGRIYVQDTLSEKGIRANRVYASESRNKYVLVLAGHTYTILYQEAEFTDVHTRRRKKVE
jgi:hypothetical protein